MFDSPRIYVASLADYNAGRLHGRWIDATLDPDEIAAETAEMLTESKEQIAEEWAIHDYEGFGGLRLSEYESFDKVSEIANAIKEHGEAVALWLANGNDDLSQFEDDYQGDWESEEQFAENFADEIGLFSVGESYYRSEQVKAQIEQLQSYFDYEKYARDLFMGDFWSATDSKYRVHVFRR